MSRWMLLGLLVVVACAPSTPRTAPHWRQVSDTATPLDQARPACKAYALDKTKNVSNESLATRAAAGAFAECMSERGWALTDQD